MEYIKEKYEIDATNFRRTAGYQKSSLELKDMSKVLGVKINKGWGYI